MGAGGGELAPVDDAGAGSHAADVAVEMLSGATGGQSARLNDDGTIAFKALSAGLTGYYRLGVQAQPEDLDGRPRNIGVKVTRPGVVARRRTGR